jgi:hypothetical protein
MPSTNTIILLCLLAFLVTSSCKKQLSTITPQKGKAEIVWLDAFTWRQKGTMPLVITVPHGGMVSPDSIPDRACTGITTATDLYTIEMAKAIDSVALADYGVRPYLVVTNLKRIKLDQNRELAEATCNNAAVSGYWTRFHNSTDTSIKAVLSHYPQCLYIDLHAHGHTIQQLELGYLVSKTQLQNLSAVQPTSTSLSNLFIANPQATVQGLLTGSNAFGTLMGAQGYPSVPSEAFPAPNAADPYFDGGYNTKRYTVATNCFGWQIESNYTGVRENAKQRALFAKAFLKSLMQFYKTWTKLDPNSFGY